MSVEPDKRPALPFHLFDRDADVFIVNRKLPHWSQPGTVAFITWRTNDSLPASVLRQWFTDRDRWLKAHGIDPAAGDWHKRLDELDRRIVEAFWESFWNRWHDASTAATEPVCSRRRHWPKSSPRACATSTTTAMSCSTSW